MEQQPDRPKRKPLVTVEWQREVDVFTRETENRVFVKMYFEARDSGLLASLPDELWKTLCVLATYMDQNGHCYPSQSRLAKDLGISRQHTNKRIQRLLAFRFQGQPILGVESVGQGRQERGRWSHNVYHIRPITGFAIFDGERSEPSKKLPSSTVSPWGDTVRTLTVSPSPSHHVGDTNQNHNINKTFNVIDSPKSTDPEEDERRKLRAQGIALSILDVCRDEHSLGSYITLARTYPEGLIFEALSMTKDAKARRKVKKSPGAFFTDTVHRLARERGLCRRPEPMAA